jgi:hypothetical protein
MRKLRPLGFIAGFVAAIVLTGGGVAAYAANGGSLLIGRSNTGTAATTLTNTRGTPLSLRAKSSSYAPLAVNSSKVVTNLNADKLDGLHATSFAYAASAHTGNIFGTSDWAPLVDGGDPDPASHVIVSVADCPTGTKLTGGGYEDYTASGQTFASYADANSWVVVSGVDSDDTTVDTPSDLIASAVCYNPRGLVSGSQPNARAAATAISLSPAAKEKLARVVARVNNK